MTSHGGVPEWPMGADCKSVGLAYPGSNPGAATRCERPLISRNAGQGPFVIVGQAVEHLGCFAPPHPVPVPLDGAWTGFRLVSSRPAEVSASARAGTSAAVRVEPGRDLDAGCPVAALQELRADPAEDVRAVPALGDDLGLHTGAGPRGHGRVTKLIRSRVGLVSRRAGEGRPPGRGPTPLHSRPRKAPVARCGRSASVRRREAPVRCGAERASGVVSSGPAAAPACRQLDEGSASWRAAAGRRSRTRRRP